VSGSAFAAPRTDVVTMRNGDRITGEILRLERGKLDFKTDHAGTISFEWDKVARVQANRVANESLGLRLRSQLGGAVGPRLVNTNRARMLVGGGLVFNEERGVNTEPTENIEGLLTFQSSYFTYDRPKTNLDVSFQYYPSLSDWGRYRLQLDASAKRELVKDLFVAVDLYDTYDSRPPSASFANNDVGIVLSLGWSY
jgi:hypothetical protein